MQFTREPIVETIISARDGHKLTLKGSKEHSAEEFIVDAVEVISFGTALFFRSLEPSKHFLLPVSDYQIVETREVRMTLKAATPERTVKIGTREKSVKETKETKPARESKSKDSRKKEKEASIVDETKDEDSSEEQPQEESAQDIPTEAAAEKTTDKKKDRRRNRKKKVIREKEEAAAAASEGHPIEERPPVVLLPPPTTLISETLAHYKNQPEFKGAFVQEKEVAPAQEVEETPQED